MPGHLVRLNNKNKRPSSSKPPTIPKFPAASKAPGLKCIRHIGSGSYGDVFHCRHTGDKAEDPPRALAAKVIHKLDPAKNKADKVEIFERFIGREIEITASLDHENVVK